MPNQIKSNYKAWEVKTQDFPETQILEEQIKFLIRFGILAPSGHNTQPWNFQLQTNVLKILICQERFLRENDIEGRQSYISMGALIENIVFAAHYYTMPYTLQLLPDQLSSKLIAIFKFDQTGKLPNHAGHLIHLIKERVSNRGKYLANLPEEAVLAELSKSNVEDIKISHLIGEAKNKLAKIMVAAQIQVMASKKFRSELSNYIKSNATNSHSGMPGFTLGIPAPVSFVADKLIKYFNLSRLSEKQDIKLLQTHTPCITVISTREDLPIDWINAGRALENFWLHCTKHGLACSPLAAAVQSPRHREDVQRLLNTDYYPQVIVRCGYPQNSVEHSPRYDLNSLIVK